MTFEQYQQHIQVLLLGEGSFNHAVRFAEFLSTSSIAKKANWDVRATEFFSKKDLESKYGDQFTENLKRLDKHKTASNEQVNVQISYMFGISATEEQMFEKQKYHLITFHFVQYSNGKRNSSENDSKIVEAFFKQIEDCGPLEENGQIIMD